MAKFLLTAWPFAGHIHPCLAIAHALRDRGHEVAFYTGASVSRDIEGEGFRCFPFDKVNEERVKTLVSQEIPYCPTFRDRVKNARLLQVKFKEWLLDTVPNQVSDLHAAMAVWHPDVLLCDIAMWAPFLVLHEASHVPVAMYSITAACMLPGPDAPAWGEGKPRPRNAWMRLTAQLERGLLGLLAKRFRNQVDALRARYGLPALPCSVTEYAGHMPAYLVPSVPEYDYLRTDLPSSVHYVGPCLWDKPRASQARSSRNDSTGGPLQAPALEWLKRLPAERPLIYVTEATIGTQEPFLLKAAVLAFSNSAFEVVMTTGRQRNPAELGAEFSAPNVRVEAYIPQSDLMPRVSVMVTLGGSGGVLAALQAGVPLVIVPTEWDRPENAQRVVEAGAGLRLDASRCTPERLRAATERVLHEPSFRANALRLGRAFAQHDGPPEAARILEQLVPPAHQELSEAERATPHLQFIDAIHSGH